MMVCLGMKRVREGELDTITAMANCLVLLSHGGDFRPPADLSPSHRVFECKTCNRQFPSFQALGGHRASHKRPRLTAGEELSLHHVQPENSPAKPKTHECPVCGLEFAIGQALGGHMRRHRAGAATASDGQATDLTLSPSQVPVVRKPNSRRVLWLDLNLTPGENGLDFQLEKVTPVLHCYL
ncbi:hypothetical protein U1Q18_026119 [Sarracenia purpurea var. burkii]